MNIEDYKYKLELHAHTSPSSRCSAITPEEMVELHKAWGYSGVALTNHTHFGADPMGDRWVEVYIDDYLRAKKRGDELGVAVYFAVEFCTDDIDALIYGIDEQFMWVSRKYLNRPFSECYDALKDDKNVLICAHPFREIRAAEILGGHKLDGIELYNNNPGHNSRIGMAGMFARSENVPILTCGSDVHHPDHGDMAALRTRYVPKDSFELAELLKSRDFLFDFCDNIVIPRTFCRKD